MGRFSFSLHHPCQPLLAERLFFSAFHQTATAPSQAMKSTAINLKLVFIGR
jgi:hypothetical protein